MSPTSSLLRLSGAVFLALAVMLSTAPAQAATRVTPGNFTGYAFDKCQAPTQEQMDTWLETSPYWGIGIYLAGINRFCIDHPLLTPEWIAEQSAKKWRILPLTLGLQASCTERPRYQKKGRRISAEVTGDFARARSQGRTEARSTVAAARSVGIAEQSTLWYDLEHFPVTNTRCRESALGFLSGWTWQLHELNYRSGVYSSASSGIKALDDARVTSPGRWNLPDQLWIAEWMAAKDYTRPPTATPPSLLSGYLRDDGWMPNDRMRQYRGGHNETYGGVTFNIDSNYMRLGRGSVPGRARSDCGVRIDFGDYKYRAPGGEGKLVAAAQCFLRKRHHYSGQITGQYDEATRRAVVDFQVAHQIPARGAMTRRTWSALMSAGGTPLLKYGAGSNAVRRLQRALNAVDAAGLPISGVFDWPTTAAVKRYQRDHGLADTGVVLDQTWGLLQAGVL